MPDYHFDVTLRPYGEDFPGEVRIDTAAKYGYWEHPDGSEGGGLWFDFVENKDEAVELLDYDGAFELPPKVIKAIRDAGFEVDPEYF